MCRKCRVQIWILGYRCQIELSNICLFINMHIFYLSKSINYTTNLFSKTWWKNNRFQRSMLSRIRTQYKQTCDTMVVCGMDACVYRRWLAGDCFCDRSVRSIRELASGQFTQVRLEPMPHTSVALTARYLRVNQRKTGTIYIQTACPLSISCGHRFIAQGGDFHGRFCPISK